MNLGLSILIMFLSSFLVEYFLISYITSNSIFDVTFSIGKLYISLITAFSMIIIHIFIHNLFNSDINKYIYWPFLIILFILIILYRYQVYINDKEYLKGMIQHNSMEILTSEKIRNKTSNKEVKELSNNIIIIKKKEIEEMKNIIRDETTIKKIINSESDSESES